MKVKILNTDIHDIFSGTESEEGGQEKTNPSEDDEGQNVNVNDALSQPRQNLVVNCQSSVL